MQNIFYIFTLFTCFIASAQSRTLEVFPYNDTVFMYYVEDDYLISRRWDTLAQPKFWQQVMRMHPDSCVLNIAATREILFTTSFVKWKEQTEEEKDKYKDSVRKLYGLDSLETLYVTNGKSDFYDFEKVIPSISRGIEIFEREEVDPWFAQSILLIESPGKIEFSNVGAYGPFQLMKRVARTYGLTVNSKVDERKDFDKSALAASRLIKKSCVPYAKKILYNHGLEYKESDLWFKLIVLHIYHAGAGNVAAVIDHIKPKEGGMELIKTMWQTQFAGFKNASQNYSQVALASNIILSDIIAKKCDYYYECE